MWESVNVVFPGISLIKAVLSQYIANILQTYGKLLLYITPPPTVLKDLSRCGVYRAIEVQQTSILGYGIGDTASCKLIVTE